MQVRIKSIAFLANYFVHRTLYQFLIYKTYQVVTVSNVSQYDGISGLHLVCWFRSENHFVQRKKALATSFRVLGAQMLTKHMTFFSYHFIKVLQPQRDTTSLCELGIRLDIAYL